MASIYVMMSLSFFLKQRTIFIFSEASKGKGKISILIPAVDSNVILASEGVQLQRNILVIARFRQTLCDPIHSWPANSFCLTSKETRQTLQGYL